MKYFAAGLLLFASIFTPEIHPQETRHDNFSTETPTAQQIPSFVSSLSTKPIQQRSVATFTVDSRGNPSTVAPSFVLDEPQSISIEHTQTDGDVVETALVRADGHEYRFNAPGDYPIEAGTYKHHANGTIYGSGDLASIVTYYRLVPHCAKLTQLPVLGWEDGHKNDFCLARGYDGVTNTSTGGKDYRKNGGGWCFNGRADACQAILDGLDPGPLSKVDRQDGNPPKPERPRERHDHDHGIH